MTANNKYWYHIAAVITMAVWGTTFVSTKILINNGLSPTEIFTYRFLMAYAAIWFFAPKKLFADNRKDELLMAGAGLTGGSIYFLAENTALETTLTSNVALLVCTAPLWTAMLSRIFYPKEKVGSNLWIGTLIALPGAALVIFNGSFVLNLNPWGDILSIVAALSWASYSVIMKNLSGRYPTMFITRKVFFYGLVTLLPFLLLPGATYNPAALKIPAVWGNLLFLGLIASLACFAIWNRIMKEIGIIQASNYIYLNPAFAILTAWLILDEQITWGALGGFVLIIAGLWIAERGFGKKA